MLWPPAMNKPVTPRELRAAPAACWVAGLPQAIDAVAAAAPAGHGFLRRQWFAAAVATYGGAAETLVVMQGDTPIAALPVVPMGPAPLRAVAVPGCYWPFRSFPAAHGAAPFDALVLALGQRARALRIGPVYDGDPAFGGLLGAARARGWVALSRDIARSYLLDIAAESAGGAWPRTSTLKKNRFHEKHLASHGVPDWRFLDGAALATGGFDALAEVEEKSWIAERTDGRDAKFTARGHGAFWRGVAEDPALAAMCHAALLTIDGAPAAFSFDLDCGTLKYAIANSYDPAFAKHSPGKLLYWRNLAEAKARGIERVDWGAGDSGYKRVIGAAPGPMIRDWLLLAPGPAALVGRIAGVLWRRSGQTAQAAA